MMINPFKNTDIEYNFFNIEMNFIYSIFNNPAYLVDLHCSSDIFFYGLNKVMFEYISFSHESNEPISYDGMYEHIRRQKIDTNMEHLMSLFGERMLISQSALYKTIEIIKNNKKRYSIKEFAQALFNDSNKISNNLDELLDKTEKYFDGLYVDIKTDGVKLSDIGVDLIRETDNIHIKGEDFFLRTKIKELDDKLALTMKNIVLLGGGAKQGKTKFLINLMSLLLENYPESLSIQWYNMEDDNAKMFRGFISPKLMLSYDDLCGKNGNLSNDQILRVKEEVNKFSKYDIEFNETPCSIKKVYKNFKAFTKKRPGKLPILIIDNIMLLTDDEQKRDDNIMNTLNLIKQTTGALIIVVHHFNDEQQDKDNLQRGYRPVLKNLKGSEAFRRVPKTVVMINYPYIYKDLMAAYKGYEEILQYLYIVEVAINRDSGDNSAGKNLVDPNLIYYFASLEYNIFKTIKSL